MPLLNFKSSFKFDEKLISDFLSEKGISIQAESYVSKKVRVWMCPKDDTYTAEATLLSK